ALPISKIPSVPGGRFPAVPHYSPRGGKLRPGEPLAIGGGRSGGTGSVSRRRAARRAPMKELHTLASSVQGLPCGRTLRPEINVGRAVSAAGGILEVLTADEQLRARLDLASRLGARAVEPRDFAELFRALYDETARVMDATVFLFALYDEASQTVS